MKTLICLLALGLVACGPVGVDSLEPGDPAPRFRLPGSDGKTYDLADFAGKRAVVIAWYPRAFTPG
jgi:peroxiredoxin Q/BCP